MKETLEEAAENYTIDFATMSAFKLGARWMQERMYSEEDMIEFAQIVISQYKFGNTNIEQIEYLKETLEKFKKK